VPIPEPVYDAEEVFEPDETLAEGAADDDSYGLSAPPARAPAPQKSADRRPCPMCGEMIRTTAVKCRYCGEVFDDTLKRSGHGRVDADQIRRFRREMHGLGGFWIFMGCLMLLLSVLAANVQAVLEGPLVAILLVLTLIYFGIGGFIFAKHMWAVWTGLVLAYLSLLGNLIRAIDVLGAAGGNLDSPEGTGFVCGLIFGFVILGAVIVQSHRVIKWAGELRRAGVSLTAAG
jgi:hypothetical protein